MDFLNNFWLAWNEGWGTTIATLMALVALLKSTGKEIKQLVSSVWHWNGWTFVTRSCGKVITRYRMRKANSVMRRELEGNSVRVEIRAFESSLRDDPRRSVRGQLKKITPDKPTWLNDYYVANALESLSRVGRVAKARNYSMNLWPTKPESYYFQVVSANSSAYEEVANIETNNMCAVYQSMQICPRESRFEIRRIAETVSPSKTNIMTSRHLMSSALPCEVCWEKEDRERDIRRLV